MIGLKHGTVALSEHEELWESEARKTIARLKKILGELASDIQHIGSTSIKTIKAKPIIDVAVAVKSFEGVLEKRGALLNSGFYFCENACIEKQLLFACGSYYDGTGDMQTHFIHVVSAGSREWTDYINFRDYMNAFPEKAKQYEQLKLSLAAECPFDPGREHYLAGKREFIAFSLRKALVWSYLGKTVTVKIDRPVGYVHKKEKYSLTYPINYGYIPGVIGGDGEELDVYVLGVTEQLDEFTGKIIGIVHRENDVEDKLVAAPDGMPFNQSEIAAAVHFQERYYMTTIEVIEG